MSGTFPYYESALEATVAVRQLSAGPGRVRVLLNHVSTGCGGLGNRLAGMDVGGNGGGVGCGGQRDGGRGETALGRAGAAYGDRVLTFW